MKLIKYNLIITICLSLLACNNSPTPQNMEEDLANCDKGKPVAYFDANMENVTTHKFEDKKAYTIEVVGLDSLNLELIQSGCERLKQEFRFTIPSTFEEENITFWVDKAIWSLNYISSQNPKLLPYLSGTTQAITYMKEAFILGERLEDGSGAYVLIDKIEQSGETLLVVELSE